MTTPPRRAPTCLHTAALLGLLVGLLGAGFALCACKPKHASTPQKPPPKRPSALGKAPAALPVRVDCQAKARPISPGIYGVAFNPQLPDDDTALYLGATARRWGGNPSSRYNWKLGNAWNAASDWYFRNLNYTQNPDWTYRDFLQQQRQWGLKTALTLPMLGWVAKDTSSVGFPRALFPSQQAFEKYHPGIGNGLSPRGKPLRPGPPSLTSLPAPPEMVEAWVHAIQTEEKEKGHGRSVHLYFLDNEPNLWHKTHRDVHPEPLSYSALLEKTITHIRAIRKADPQAHIAGPCEWGWTHFFWSAQDMARGGKYLAPDRRAHGNVPLVPWYLRKLYEHQQKTGERMLDVLDLHHYPQGPGVWNAQGGKVDEKTSALRLRMTRSLWDPSYKDESWVKDTIRLIPRMRQWVDENYPGLQLSIGEYNFGAENHPSGGLAQAEALGRFAQEGLDYAFLWHFHSKGSAAAQGFRAFRNYDGNGAHFLGYFLPSEAPQGVSAFASTHADRSKLVLVLLNREASTPKTLSLSLERCGPLQTMRTFVTRFDEAGFVQTQASPGGSLDLPALSLAVVELHMEGEKQ